MLIFYGVKIIFVLIESAECGDNGILEGLNSLIHAAKK
jgi:hypothetical protein